MPNHVLQDWLNQHAEGLNDHAAYADQLLAQLAAGQAFRHGVPQHHGGLGNPVTDAVSNVALLAQHSLTAAFVTWSQRTFIEYLLESQNTYLIDRYLADLLDGTLAGATGLSNAMKFLSGIEQLQIDAQHTDQGWVLNGYLPWVTNLHPDGFLVAVAAKTEHGAALFVVPSNSPGFTRNPDLDLISMRGSYTASASLSNVLLSDDYLLDRDATRYLPKVRPVFLGLQCALAIGLIQKSLHVVTTNHRASDLETAALIDTTQNQLDQLQHQLKAGLHSQDFRLQAQPLFRIKIELATLVQTAINAELQTLGGKAYLTQHEQGFVRRLKESAFIPVVTPSIVQLKAELQKAQRGCAS